MIRANHPRFSPGTILATPNALSQLPQSEIQWALARHLAGDWGNCCLEDAEANDAALKSGGRLLSVYHSSDQIKFWIITEAGRSSTTVLFPEDY